MMLESGNNLSFIYLFIHSFQKKISLDPHYAFGTGPGNEETKVSHTQATELTA